MGGDGGSIPCRVDVVKTKGYTASSQGSMGFSANGVRRVVEENLDPREVHRTRMTTCALSGEKLSKPVVACRAGYLFNKEQVLRRLLDKNMPEEFAHISSMKDILNLENFPGTCPITARELDDGITKSEAMWPCGCVLSEKALLRVSLGDETQTCINCSSAVHLRTKLSPDQHEFAAQLDKAMEMRAKRRRHEEPGSKSDGSKRLKASISERDNVLKQYKNSETYRNLFHPS